MTASPQRKYMRYFLFIHARMKRHDAAESTLAEGAEAIAHGTLCASRKIPSPSLGLIDTRHHV